MTTPWAKIFRNGLIAMACSCLIGTAGAQGLDAIFTQQSSGQIDNINTTTGASTTLYTATGNFWNGAAYDQQNGLLYIDDVGSANFTVNQVITNNIYSFNPLNPSAGVTLVGSVSGQAAFTGGGFYNGIYYVIPTGSNQLIGYNVTGGTVTQVSSQTLGGLGTGVVGLSLGDIDFVGSTLYVSAGTTTSTAVGATVSSTYTLYRYDNFTSGTTTPTYAVTEAKIGVGIANDINSGQLIMFNSDGTIQNVDPATGLESGSITLTGPAASGGAGDFTIVPEPSTYALWSMLLLGALVMGHRTLRPRLQLTCA